MQVTVESTSGLERKVRVQLPENEVQSKVDQRLENLAREARIAGFRPGKVPVKVVRQRFGRQVRDEVVGELVQSSFHDALAQEQLQPAGMPTIDPLEASPGSGVDYTATFDVYPEIDLPDPATLEIARPVAEVEDANVERMIDTLRRQRVTWSPVERAAADTDRAVIDFAGAIDGEPLEHGRGEEVPVELGQSRMIPGFEAGLVGLSAGDRKTLELAFPEDYHVEALAGKPVAFEIEVHRVEEPVLPEVDDEFAASYGVAEGGAEALRQEVRANMGRELGEALRSLTKQRVMEALLGGREIEVPAALVTQENERTYEGRKIELRHSGIDPDQVGLTPDVFEPQSRKRVQLGLVLAEFIKANDLRPDPERVRERIETIASTYEDPDEVITWYYSDNARMSDVESTVLEDQVVEWILERASVTEDRTSFDEVLNPGQTSGDA